MKNRLLTFTTILLGIAWWRTQSSLAPRRSLKTLRLSALLTSLLVLTSASYSQESAKFEKIRDTSPDGKFAVRISCSSEPEDPNDIDPNLITAVELVSLPSKKIVMNLPHEEGGFGGVIWSQDSKWFAFPLSEGHRVTYTHVYHRAGDDFARHEQKMRCGSMSKAMLGTNM